jgi:hypothetical protein
MKIKKTQNFFLLLNLLETNPPKAIGSRWNISTQELQVEKQYSAFEF